MTTVLCAVRNPVLRVRWWLCPPHTTCEMRIPWRWVCTPCPCLCPLAPWWPSELWNYELAVNGGVMCVYVAGPQYIQQLLFIRVFRDSSVGMATRYWLHGSGIEYQRRRYFPHQSTLGPRNHPASSTMHTGSLPGANWPGRGVDHRSSSSAGIRVELYQCCPSGRSWPIQG